jgi:hypothetical protein
MMHVRYLTQSYKSELVMTMQTEPTEAGLKNKCLLFKHKEFKPQSHQKPTNQPTNKNQALIDSSK